MSGGGELVRLLDGVRDDRALVLLTVPRALDPQPAGERVEAPQRLDVLVLAHRRGYWPGGVELGGACCVAPPGAPVVGVGVAFGPCLHCWITYPLRQSVLAFHFFA